MEQLLVAAERTHELMTWALMFIAVLTFFGLVLTAWVIYISRGTRASVERVAATAERVAAMLTEMREDSKRLQHYLFVKLGPAELK